LSSATTIRTRAIVFLAILPIAMGACSNGSSRDSSASDVLSNVSALVVRQVATPPLRVPHHQTRGTYPQVSNGKLNLKTVNAALRNAVLDEQREYARFARKALSRTPKVILRKYHGVFETTPQRWLISSSSVLVSALIPVRENLPGGTATGTWVSVTVQVPSGDPVRVEDLFAEPTRGLEMLARVIRKKFLSTNSCVRQSFENAIPEVHAYYAKGFAPTASNYQHFALTTNGIVVGFPMEQVAGPVCYRVAATAPYVALRPYLSELGQKLITGVRQPQR